MVGPTRHGAHCLLRKGNRVGHPSAATYWVGLVEAPAAGCPWKAGFALWSSIAAVAEVVVLLGSTVLGACFATSKCCFPPAHATGVGSSVTVHVSERTTLDGSAGAVSGDQAVSQSCLVVGVE